MKKYDNYISLTSWLGFRYNKKGDKLKMFWIVNKKLEIHNLKFKISGRLPKYWFVLIRLPGLYIQKHNSTLMFGTNNYYFTWYHWRLSMWNKKRKGTLETCKGE